MDEIESAGSEVWHDVNRVAELAIGNKLVLYVTTGEKSVETLRVLLHNAILAKFNASELRVEPVRMGVLVKMALTRVTFTTLQSFGYAILGISRTTEVCFDHRVAEALAIHAFGRFGVSCLEQWAATRAAASAQRQAILAQWDARKAATAQELDAEREKILALDFSDTP